MSDDPTPEAPPDTQDDPPTPPDPTPDPPKKPWGDDADFDADKAWKLIENLRKERDDLKPLAKKARELEEASKTEVERLAERATAAEERATIAERRALLAEARAERPTLTAAQVARLQGDSVEELLADADELYGAPESQPSPPPRRPRERLTPGAVPDADPEPEIDISKVSRF